MNLRGAWIDAAIEEHARCVNAATRAGEERITEYFDAIGWRWAITRAGGERYSEALRRGNPGLLEYCGIFWGAMGLRLEVEPFGESKIADFFAQKHGLDLRYYLHPRVAEYVMPSTYRIAHSGHWGKIPRADRITVHELDRGDIITVVTGRNKPYGDHFAGVVEVDSEAQTVQTIEANTWGVLGDGTEGRGVVRRSRRFDEIRRIYRFDERHFLVTAEGDSDGSD